MVLDCYGGLVLMGLWGDTGVVRWHWVGPGWNDRMVWSSGGWLLYLAVV